MFSKAWVKLLLGSAFLFALSSFNCSNNVSPQEPEQRTADITIEEAEEILLQQVLNNQTEGRSILEWEVKVKAGEIIYNAADSTEYVAKRDAWFFFIDDRPTMYYAKPVQYVFIYCDNGEVEAIVEEWWPTILKSMKRILWEGISLEMAELILLREVLFNDTLGRIIKELPREVKAGEVIKNALDSTEYPADRDAWFFFIDNKPGYVYAKPVWWVFIYRDNGEWAIIHEEWWPNVFNSLERIFWAGITLPQAEKVLLQQVLKDTTEGKFVYELPAKLSAGSIVKNDLDGSEYVAKTDAWFFMIDDRPGAIYTKPVRYVFIYTKDPKNFDTYREGWWPDIYNSLIPVLW